MHPLPTRPCPTRCSRRRATGSRSTASYRADLILWRWSRQSSRYWWTTATAKTRFLKIPPKQLANFVCATSKETGDTVCLTSYRPRRLAHLYDSTKIWRACRATSAATTFFDPIAIGPFQEQFVDGALGANNPVYAL
ncbi:hypothetical protein BGZ61DRAFT_152848 [Ilyonectria robusta]|uniref:uncharacterized protein n=1 Tax=Ilyonectria robusta TaxID=1079257 RepID=UPI001E8D3FDA|nr:uncharacterized protein BGZ61DRAFT_152848 [Ilyonectria robusta]KAH8661016.1 hypothetical protein BGZ61DRAFT_152848 [Ilyonectria robusta]